jgi:hypothetical protein
MNFFDPITTSILANQQTGSRQSIDKKAQMKRAAERAKDSTTPGDRFESAVESTDVVDPSHDENKKDRQPKRHSPHPQNDRPDDLPSLDLTA